MREVFSIEINDSERRKKVKASEDVVVSLYQYLIFDHSALILKKEAFIISPLSHNTPHNTLSLVSLDHMS